MRRQQSLFKLDVFSSDSFRHFPEVLARYGNPAQQEKWLKPLLEGKTRSSFAMTEKGIASSDATNIRTSIKLDPKTDEIVINGHKWWISGAGDPRNALHLVLGKSLVLFAPLSFTNENESADNLPFFKQRHLC